MAMTRYHVSLAALLVAGWALTAPATASAQDAAAASAGSGLVDRIAAVVGDSIVTSLELDEDIVRLQAQGQFPATPSPDQLDAVRRQLLNNRVDELLMVQAAERDTTLKVTDDEVQAEGRKQLEQMQRNFPSIAAFQAALKQQGLSPGEYQQRLETDARKALLVQRYLDKVARDRKPPAATEAQIEKYFDDQKAQLGQRPATIAFKQIVVAPVPGDSALQAARAEADSILARIRAGEDFAALAKRYSDDPGTKDKGGDLGWFRRGQMVQAFEDAAFALSPGQVSDVIKSPFGFHIIKLERVRGAERSARHILIKPKLTASDSILAYRRAEEVAAHLRAGDEPFDTLVARYNDPTEPDTDVPPQPRNRLPAPYSTELADVQVGQVVGPFPLTGGDVTKWAVVKVVELKPAGEYTLDDPALREQIRQQVERQNLMDEIIGDLRRRTYVDIRL
jgi:peptidyl-prolyl cis-trans isomerase SurA